MVQRQVVSAPSARHTIDRLPQPYQIDIYWQEDRYRLPLDLTGLSRTAHVAVLAPRVQLSPTFPLPPTEAGLAYGQDVYFIGFPYDIMGGLGNLLEGRPLRRNRRPHLFRRPVRRRHSRHLALLRPQNRRDSHVLGRELLRPGRQPFLAACYQMVRAAGVALWRLRGASLVTRGQPFSIAVA